MLKFLFFLVLLVNKSLCNDDTDLLSDLKAVESQIESDPIGKGFLVSAHVPLATYDNISESLECLRHEDFDTGFIIIYSNQQFLDYNVPWVESLEEDGMKVQLVIQPSIEEKTADAIFQRLTEGLTRNNMTVEFLWIDTISLTGEYKDDSVKLFNDLEKLAEKNGIVVGIKTTKGSWVYSLDNPTNPATSGQLLWLDCCEQSFTTFDPFGGWTSITALTGSTRTKCIQTAGKSYNTMSILYRRDDIDNELTHSTVAPPPEPTENTVNEGKALTISIDPDDVEWTDFALALPCIKDNYDSVFLYIFAEHDYIYAAEKIIPQIIFADLNLQFVIKPRTSVVDFNAADVVDTVVDRFKFMKIYPKMIWLDTSDFALSSSDDNIGYIKQFVHLFSAERIELHVNTRLEQWNDYFDNIKTFSQHLLWDNLELKNAVSFIPFGGWSSPTVYSYIAANNCSTGSNTGHYDVFGTTYLKDKIDFSLDPTTPVTPVGTMSTSSGTPSPIGRGLVIEANENGWEDLYSDIRCYVENQYNALFLYVLKDDLISSQLLDMLGLLQQYDLGVQFVIQPSFENNVLNPSEIVKQIVESINLFDFQPQYFWIDVTEAQNSNSSHQNVALLQSFIISLMEYNVDFGVITNKDVWLTSFGGYQELNNKLLWDNSNLSGFDDFTPYADWKDIAVYSKSYTGLSCPDLKSHFTYRDALYRTSELNFNLPPLTTQPPPPNSGSSTSTPDSRKVTTFKPELTTKSSSTVLSYLFFISLLHFL